MGFLKIYDRIENYFLSRILLLKFETHEIIARFAALLLSSFLFISLAILILFFLGITFSILIGDYFGNPVYGFASISILLIIILLVLIIFKEKLLETPIMDTTIKELNRIEKDEKKKEKTQG